MFTKACKNQEVWQLSNSWGHTLELPCSQSYSGCEIFIGILGTRTRSEIKGGKTKLMAEMLAALNRPIYLLDTRRNGTGAQSSWSPREFASVIPAAFATKITYSFLHLPCLAPSVALLDEARKSGLKWREFRTRYLEELSLDSLDVARAFVEAAQAAGGLAIFLCAEADRPAFDQLSEPEQEESYCHRFALAKQVARRCKDVYGAVTVKQVHLDLVDFKEQWGKSGKYIPRLTEL